MPYFPRPAQSSLDTEGLRRFSEEEYREIARAWTDLESILGIVTSGSGAMTGAASYVAGAVKKNYILNGAMMVSQENGSTAGTTSGYYMVDQFLFSHLTTGTLTSAQVASVTPGGSPNRIRVTVTSPDTTIAAGEGLHVYHAIEGFRSADLQFGTASAKTVTIRFGCKAPAGTYCVVLLNSVANRSYVSEYVISASEANTDVVKTITFVGDTTGTWLKDANPGILIRWGLSSGSTYHQAAGSWSTGNAIGSSTMSNFLGTNGNVFELFDVGLYEGSVAPPFVVPDYVRELALCQRYWQRYSSFLLSGYHVGGSAQYNPIIFPTMRIAPTGVCVASGGGSSNATTPNMAVLTPSTAYAYATVTVTGGYYMYVSITLNARLA